MRNQLAQIEVQLFQPRFLGSEQSLVQQTTLLPLLLLLVAGLFLTVLAILVGGGGGAGGGTGSGISGDEHIVILSLVYFRFEY